MSTHKLKVISCEFRINEMPFKERRILMTHSELLWRFYEALGHYMLSGF